MSGRFPDAFDALIQFTDQALQKSSMVALLSAIINRKGSLSATLDAISTLQSLPLGLHPHLLRHVDHHLSMLAQNQSSTPEHSGSATKADYLGMLHAMRVVQDDYRGAVGVLFDRLKIVRRSARARSDPQSLELRNVLLTLINAMSCVSPDETYIVTDLDGSVQDNGGAISQNGKMARKRIIVTLDDLRKEYQQVLDRCSRIERGDFDFDLDGDSEMDDEMEVEQNHSN
ncbi:hypothetical protein LPUS_06463, partial [Lasallia pustulata]